MTRRPARWIAWAAIVAALLGGAYAIVGRGGAMSPNENASGLH
jgi:hypothetical protein